MKYGFITPVAVLAVTLAVAPGPAQSEEQLPIDELFPCEIVLHELVAELGKYRAEAKRVWTEDNAKSDKAHELSDEAAVQTWDKAITLARKKFARCPY